MKKGCKYGTHRVIEPEGVLPQPAKKISNDMEIFSNEILIDVIALNIDSASFTQIEEEAGHDVEKIKAKIKEIVAEKGKMQNPVTGSGGMLIGTVEKIGDDLVGKTDLKVGDKIATLVSLSLTPLRIDEIIDIKPDIDRVEIKGKAVLFESGIYAVLPTDMSETLALAALDVAGAPAQVAKLVKPCQSVAILGSAGKSGMLCAYEAVKRVGPTGRVIGVVRNEKEKELLKRVSDKVRIVIADATKPMDVLHAVLEANDGNEVDVAINCVNVANTEMSTILPVKEFGIAYFFSMATAFTKAALGAEGVGKDITMIVGNGYTVDHAAITLEELRESTGYNEHMKLGNKIIAKTFDEIIKVLADVMVLNAEDTVTINQTKLPAYVVQERFRELDSSHMEYLVNSLSENEAKIRNVRAFILTAAYNAPSNMDAYYTALVSYDMREGGL